MELYWLLRLPHLHTLFQTVGTLSTIFSGFSIIIFILSALPDPKGTYDMDARGFRPYKYTFIYLAIIAFVSFLISSLLPTTTDLALMMGWNAINSNSVQEVIEILKDKIK